MMLCIISKATIFSKKINRLNFNITDNDTIAFKTDGFVTLTFVNSFDTTDEPQSNALKNKNLFFKYY